MLSDELRMRGNLEVQPGEMGIHWLLEMSSRESGLRWGGELRKGYGWPFLDGWLGNMNLEFAIVLSIFISQCCDRSHALSVKSSCADLQT